jgi:hypothetical protein
MSNSNLASLNPTLHNSSVRVGDRFEFRVQHELRQMRITCAKRKR